MLSMLSYSEESTTISSMASAIMHMTQLIGYNESSVHSSECLYKEIGESIPYWFNSTLENSKTKRSKFTQEEQRAGNKLGAEIHQVETKGTIQRINKTRSWFFEKINKVDKPLCSLTRGHNDHIQINKIRNEKGDIKTTETKEIQNIIRSFYKSLYSTQLEIWIKWTIFQTDTRHQS